MTLKKFETQDTKRLVSVFQRSIYGLAAEDYSFEECQAWAPVDVDLQAWQERLNAQQTWVAWEGKEVAGFVAMDDQGYIDMLFVDPDFAGQGVARKLMAKCLDTAEALGLEELNSNVSKTARRFFARQGFKVIADQKVNLRGQVLVNYKMAKTL